MKKKLLIVDDDQDLARLLELAAQKREFECEVALSGKDCLTKVRDYKPDLILLDMNLPNISGLGILRELKNNKNHSNIPVIAVSVVKQEEVVNEAMNLGAVAYFAKSENMDQLFDLVREYI